VCVCSCGGIKEQAEGENKEEENTKKKKKHKKKARKPNKTKPKQLIWKQIQVSNAHAERASRNQTDQKKERNGGTRGKPTPPPIFCLLYSNNNGEFQSEFLYPFLTIVCM
jgi:hypothetical protein